MPFNVEIKAKAKNPERIRRILRKHGTEFRGVDHQVDTYFNVPHGRLKLREGNIENYLVYYERENKKGPKESKVLLYEHTPDSSLKDILIRALGTKVIVEKDREIYYLDNVNYPTLSHGASRLGAWFRAGSQAAPAKGI